MELSLGVPTIADLSWGHVAAIVILILVTTFVTRSANAILDLAIKLLKKVGFFYKSAPRSRLRSLALDSLMFALYAWLIYVEVSSGEPPTNGSIIWLIFLCLFGLFMALNVLWDIAMIVAEKGHKK